MCPPQYNPVKYRPNRPLDDACTNRHYNYIDYLDKKQGWGEVYQRKEIQAYFP